MHQFFSKYVFYLFICTTVCRFVSKDLVSNLGTSLSLLLNSGNENEVYKDSIYKHFNRQPLWSHVKTDKFSSRKTVCITNIFNTQPFVINQSFNNFQNFMISLSRTPIVFENLSTIKSFSSKKLSIDSQMFVIIFTRNIFLIEALSVVKERFPIRFLSLIFTFPYGMIDLLL